MLRGDSIRVVHPLFQTEGGGATPTSPLQLHIGEISKELAIQLNELWHSRLPKVSFFNIKSTRHSICFGAEFQNIWYAVAIWSSPVTRFLDNKVYLELRRFAIAPDAPRNTASRMLRIMRVIVSERVPEVRRLVSYQDADVHSGTIYRAAGWEKTFRSRPGKNGWISGRVKYTGRKSICARNPQQSYADKIRWEIALKR